MSCLVTINPATSLYWTRDGTRLQESSKYRTLVLSHGRYTHQLCLIVKNLDVSDYGEYKCVAENDIDRVDEKISLHRMFIYHCIYIYSYIVMAIDGGMYLNKHPTDHCADNLVVSIIDLFLRLY